MKNRKIMKRAVVLLIIVAIFLSLNVSAITVNILNEENNPRYIKTNNPKPLVNTIQSSQGPVIFFQTPYAPDEDWAFYTSDVNSGHICTDDFWEMQHDICDIHWWGLGLFWDNGWSPCDPTGMLFEIIFYENAGGVPGVPRCVYTNVAPTMTPTGEIFAGQYEMYYFEFDLNPCCGLEFGFVSIQSIFSPNDCWFLWAASPLGNLNALQDSGAGWVSLDSNLAFVLTADGPNAEPAIGCDPGLLNWIDVAINSSVTGSFTVRNFGQPGSLLLWKVDSWPTWGTDWTFTPSSGALLEGDGITVSVSFEAPDQQMQEYTGNITVVNRQDTSDLCIMPVYLKTPKAKEYSCSPLLQLLFEHFPNMFPILRQILAV
jgi:hypothetical protein